MKKILFLCLFLLTSTAFAESTTVNVIAAENFYGDVAQQLGKPYVQVISVMNNPNQDPHLFSASPRTAVILHKADIVIENGIGYDAWMDRLYAANHTKALLINVAQCSHKTLGMNPHIWYDPKTMPVFAQVFTNILIQKDPEHQVTYEKNLDDFLKIAQAYQARVATLREKTLGIKVTATEPVAGYLVQALGLEMLNQKFQQDVMNETDLTPKEIIDFQKSLSDSSDVRLFIYNVQVESSITEQLKKRAVSHHIPVVGVSEMMPNHTHFYDWMNATLNDFQQGLL